MYIRQSINIKVRLHGITHDAPVDKQLLLLAEFCDEGEAQTASTFIKSEVQAQIRTRSNSRSRFISAVETSRLFCTDTQTLQIRYTLNSNLVSWHYGFMSNKSLKDMRHFLLATLLLEEQANELKVVGQKRSPLFKIACVRRNFLESMCAELRMQNPCVSESFAPTCIVMRGSEQHLVRRKKLIATTIDLGPSDDESKEFRLPKKRSLSDKDVIPFKFNDNGGVMNEIEEVYASFQMQQQNSPLSYMFDEILLGRMGLSSS